MTRLRPLLVLCLVCAMPARADGSATAVDLTLSCDAPTRRVYLPPAASLRIGSTGYGWLEIAEAGVDLAVEAVPEGAFELAVPPRLGRHFVPVQGALVAKLRRAQPSSGLVVLRPRLWCAPATADARVIWYRDASDLSNELVPVPKGASQSELLARVERLAGAASTPETSAVAAHLRAQILFATGAAADAAPAFARAEHAWQQAGDGERAIAARVGRVEDLIRAARYEDALRWIARPMVLASSPSYFGNRLASARCMVLRYLGRIDEALPCYQASIGWLREAGEDTERASMLIDEADVLRRLGQGAIAEERTAEARAIAVGPYAPFVRGRADLILYDLLLDRGDVVGAIDRMQVAMGEFSEMGDARWQANAMLRAAWLYAQLGAVGEARSLIASGRALLNEKDAPARIAAAWMLSAEAEMQDGDPRSALVASRKAEAIYARLGMAAELDDCRALIAGLLLEAGEHEQADALLRNRDPGTSGKISWTLVEAEVSLVQGKLARTRKLLSSRGIRQGRRFADDIRVVAIEARLLAAEGKRDDALAVLREAARSIAAAAGAVDNRLLAGLLRRGSIPLRRIAFDLLLQEAGGAPGPDEDLRVAAEAWNWLAMAADGILPNRSEGNDAASKRFDEVLARQLLADPNRSWNPGAPAAARSLLHTLAARRHSEPNVEAVPAVATLEQFQAKLPTAAVFVAHLDGGKRGGMLWIDRNHARFNPAVAASDLRQANAALLARLARTDSTLAEIDTAAEALSRMVFDSAPEVAQPARLLVAFDGVLGAIPWSVLRRSPGADQLVATATTSFVQLRNDCCEPLAESNRVRVVVAPQAEADSGLAPLPVAASEMDLVRNALASAGLQVESALASDRDAVFGALAAPGEWVHIAAHGQTMPDRLGRSGIWIERGEKEGPQFLSGIGMLGHDVRSELVVMDGCELDARGGAGEASPSFANAAAKAGARNVIAAMWPVSDSAAATWVPAFYRAALGAGGPRFARALQAAQLQLRASRRYRHPYYWASLRHTEVIGTGVAASDARMARR